MPGDGRCIAHKPTREKIGSRFLDILPMGGLTRREFNGKRALER